MSSVMLTHLDELMPVWRHRHRHRVRVAGPPRPMLPAVAAVTWAATPLFRMLMAGRPGRRTPPPGGSTVLHTLTSRGFTLLHDGDDEVVFGAAVRVRVPVGPAELGAAPAEAFRAFHAPDHYKVAFNFRMADGRLSTETRVLATDPATARRFRRYWWLIRLPSGLIRREWLYAIRREMAGTTTGRAGLPVDRPGNGSARRDSPSG